MDGKIIWQDAIYENREEYAQEYLDIMGEECLNLDEFIADRVNEFLECERENLHVEIPTGIVTLADLGLWNGRRNAYSDKDERFISDCLKSHCDGYMKFFVDENGEFKASESHHDGTNYYAFRKWRDGLTDEDKIDALIAYGNGHDEEIMAATLPLGEDIGRVYGW